ncbi:precorrin-3B synthase [Streptomyces sp. NPDC086091]|uniref:precorrin-3B synthase n=1 Tax=Streptomyces sp. NPDC086091 TaxID=3365751 RepID=UPI00381BD3C4
MSSVPPPTSSQATPAVRDRGDACPGTLRLHDAADGALARVRVPGGVLTVRQARALIDATGRWGDGELHLTSRGNVQLRGLRDACGADLAGLLDAAGLLPSRSHERVRNVVASPLSGLDGRGAVDVRPWLVALDAALCASGAARELSGRFLFALDDGRGDVAALDADITVRAVPDGGALVRVGPAPDALAVAADDAPAAALLAAEAFTDVVRRSGERVWRIGELGARGGELGRLVRERFAASGIGADPVGLGADPVALGADPVALPSDPADPASRTEGPAPGVLGRALSVHAPLGRLTAPQWRALADVAAGFPDGELRLTPWRGVVVPLPRGLAPDRAAAALDRLAATGLVTDPASPWPRVGACTGRPGCAKSRADVRADAARTLPAAGRSRLPLYWSGCERRCGRPRGAHVDVLAAPDGGYRLTGPDPGRTGSVPRTADLPGTDPDPARLAAALAAISP